MSKKELNLLQLTAIQMTQLGARPTKIMWCEIVQLHPLSAPSNHVPDDILRDSLTPRRPMSANSAEDSARGHLRRLSPSVDCILDPGGTGTVRTLPPLPTRSTMAPCPCLICRSSTVRADSSALHNPRPTSMEIIARSRTLRRSSPSAFSSRNRAWSSVSQFPMRAPSCFAPLTQRIPAASSGLSRPESAASYASRLTAARRWFMVFVSDETYHTYRFPTLVSGRRAP